MDLRMRAATPSSPAAADAAEAAHGSQAPPGAAPKNASRCVKQDAAFMLCAALALATSNGSTDAPEAME